MQKDFKLLLKFLISCMIPREGNTYQISWDHNHFIFYFKNEDKINISAYIFNHLCEAIRESTKHHKENVSYARLLSELFSQGRLINTLKTFPDNKDLKEIHGNILSVSVFENMKLLKKSEVVASKMPLSVRCTNPDYLEDYPVITNMENHKVIRLYFEHAFK